LAFANYKAKSNCEYVSFDRRPEAHLNTRQFRQLCDAPRTVYLAFDDDTNGSGQQAAQSLACRLREQGVNARRVSLPEGHDPNSFFLQGGDAQQFQSLLEGARV